METEVLSRTVRIKEDFVDQISHPSERRFARILLLARFGRQSKSQCAVLKVGLHTLAEMGDAQSNIAQRSGASLDQSTKAAKAPAPPHNILRFDSVAVFLPAAFSTLPILV
jgi:hypothetical protein